MHGCFVTEPPVHCFPPSYYFSLLTPGVSRTLLSGRNPAFHLPRESRRGAAHSAQGARTASPTGSATSLPAFPAEHNQRPSPRSRGHSLWLQVGERVTDRSAAISRYPFSKGDKRQLHTSFTSLATRWYLHAIPALPRFLRITRPSSFFCLHSTTELPQNILHSRLPKPSPLLGLQLLAGTSSLNRITAIEYQKNDGLQQKAVCGLLPDTIHVRGTAGNICIPCSVGCPCFTSLFQAQTNQPPKVLTGASQETQTNP